MGVLDKVVDAASKVGTKMAAAPGSEAAGIKAKQDNIKQYMDATAKTSPAPKAPVVNSPADRIRPTSKFGDKPGEQRLDVSDMTKPLTQYAKGTTRVPKTGAAMLHEGEAVIPAHENPMSGMYDKVPGMKTPRKPKKEIDHIKIRKAKSGGHIVEHHHTSPADHKMEEHVMPNMDALHAHMEDTMGTPNPGEAEADQGQSGIPAAPAAPAAPAMGA